MSTDVAEIQSTLSSISVQAAPEQIQNKLILLARFKVTGAEAKRNIIRSLSRAAGVDPKSALKGSTSPIQISDIKEEGKWIALKVKVIELWEPSTEKIAQTGLFGDPSGVIKFKCEKKGSRVPCHLPTG